MELSEKKIKVPTTGLYDFERLILDGEAKYVDKTALLYELAMSKADSQLFISRPRRFGKSLMLSTLKEPRVRRRALISGLILEPGSTRSKAQYKRLHIPSADVWGIRLLQRSPKVPDFTHLSETRRIMMFECTNKSDESQNMARGGVICYNTQNFSKGKNDEIRQEPRVT